MIGMLSNSIRAGFKAGGFGLKAGFAAGKSPVGRTMMGAAGKMGLAYSVIQGTDAAASYVEQNQIPGANIGGFYPGALRAAGMVLGGGAMAKTAIRSTGKMIGMGNSLAVSKMSTKSWAQNAGAIEKVGKFGKAMENFSYGPMMGKGGKLAGKGMASVAMGLGKAPFMPIIDSAYGLGKVTGFNKMATNAARRGGRAFQGTLNASNRKWAGGVGKMATKVNQGYKNSMGARMFGWGAAVGSAKFAVETRRSVPGGDETYDDMMQYNAGRGLAMQGQQMYNPNTGGGPRRMDPNATAGLTQSLHRLR